MRMRQKLQEYLRFRKERKTIPKHWKKSSWEEKARENPLYAIMTTRGMSEADAEKFSPAHVKALMDRGRDLYAKHVLPVINQSGFSKNESFIVEYGCGAGRILNAVVENGYSCAGIDISATMLKHCRDLVPGVQSLHLCHPETCKTDIEDDFATIVYSYAVVQHISSLRAYQNAIFEMCRILKPNGFLALQINCEDLSTGDLHHHGRTENFERYSLHWAPGESRPYLRHEHDHWSGVYIGYDLLQQILAEGGIDLLQVYPHNPNKLRAAWVVGIKRRTGSNTRMPDDVDRFKHLKRRRVE